MSSSLIEHELNAVRATAVEVTDDEIRVDFEDGRTVTVPILWYPRLMHATPEERANYEIGPVGVEWPDVEADFSYRGLLLGRKSGENPECFRFWLENRRQGRRVTVQDWLQLRQQQKQATPQVTPAT